VDSYDRAIVPLLEMLNITGFMPSTEFNEITNVKGYVENIFNPLLTWIENEIPTAPFSNLMELLPNIAYSLEFGLVEFWLKTIKTTIRYDIDGVFDYWLGDVDFDITERRLPPSMCTRFSPRKRTTSSTALICLI
jgi:hypothetical protein